MPQKGSQLDYTLNIIDTPGFGDTKGIERDQRTVDQIRVLFSEPEPKGVLELDAVCFIVKAPDARLTASQNYIFNSLLALFGTDIQSNICSLITFADGAEPPVLASLEKANLPFKPTFEFNNSALFAKNTNIPESSLSPLFWKMGYNSFQKFFDQLYRFKTKSLTLTKAVLQEREQLKASITSLHTQVQVGLLKQSALENEIEILKKHEREIEDNKDFEYEVVETSRYKVQLNPGEHVTNCVPCNITCHERCIIANNKDKKGCAVMEDGYCTVCSKHCIWSDHENARYVIKFKEEKVKKTYMKMKRTYEKAKGLTFSHELLIKELRKDVYQLLIFLEKTIADMKRSKNRLNKIALRPDPLSTVEHIDLLILAEKKDGKEGFTTRIKKLNEFRERALLCENIQNIPDELQSTNEKVPPRGSAADSFSKTAKKGFEQIKNFISPSK